MAYKKYFTLSFDDGLEQDKKIIKILKQSGITGCTFNLNGGLLGTRAVIGRLGNMGMVVKEDRSLLNKNGIMKYVPNDRIPEDEIAQVYQGYEVAAHGFMHENLKKVSDQEADESISRDKETLSRVCGTQIRGFAYPYGATSETVIDNLKKNDMLYARTIKSSKNFEMPADRFQWNPTCWMISDKVLDYAKKFIELEARDADLLFYVWGHGYEFDFGTRESNWDKLKRLCGMMAGQDDIVSCTNYEVLNHEQ